MKILTIILVLLIGCFIYYAYPIWRAVKVSLKIQESAVPYEQHPEDANMKILVAGDSTGVGTGAGEGQFSTAGRLGRDYPKADIINISENGLRLEGLARKLEKLSSDSKYDLILMQIGANDITGLTSLKAIEERLSAVLNYATTHSSEVIVVTSGNIGLSKVFRAPLSTFISRRTLKVRNSYMEKIGMYSSVNYVDLFKDAEHDIFITDVEKYYAKDLFHPSKDGYGIWYEEIKKVLDKNNSPKDISQV